MSEIHEKLNKCRLCAKEKPLGKSHVIPKSFFERFQEEKMAAMLISNTQGAYPKKSRTGIYDPTILCLDCEKEYFQDVDDYAAEVLLNSTAKYFAKEVGPEGVAFMYSDGVDQHLLMRFFVSVLWRASVSKDSFFKRVNLGPYEIEAAKVILHPDKGVPKIFSALLSMWKDLDEKDSGLMMDPFKEKWDGVNAYRFYFGYFVAYIKVDQRDFIGVFEKLALGNADTLRVIGRNIEKSPDGIALRCAAVESILNHKRRTGKI